MWQTENICMARSLSWQPNPYRACQFYGNSCWQTCIPLCAPIWYPSSWGQGAVECPLGNGSQSYRHSGITWGTSKNTPVGVLPAGDLPWAVWVRPSPEFLKGDSTVQPSLRTTVVESPIQRYLIFGGRNYQGGLSSLSSLFFPEQKTVERSRTRNAWYHMETAGPHTLKGSQWPCNCGCVDAATHPAQSQCILLESCKIGS